MTRSSLLRRDGSGHSHGWQSSGGPDPRAALQAQWDVIVIGAGNAGMVAAMAARDHGARVLVLERATRQFRGGNSRHTRNIRCVHSDQLAWNTGAYTYDELWKDLGGVGTGPSNEELASLTVKESELVPEWMVEHGASFQPPLAGTLHLGRTNTFFLGGGKALINAYHRRAEAQGICTIYEADVEELILDGTLCEGVVVRHGDSSYRTQAATVVCASGGFEGNIEWLKRYWGDAADNYHIRGPKTNDGHILARLLEAGAQSAGEERGFHSVAVDARSPKFDGGIATRLDAIPFGVVLNNRGERFYDEGEDLWPKRYAIWGRNIALQPDQIAFCLWDSKVQGRFLPPMYGAYKSESIYGLAESIGLEPRAATQTIAGFNAAVAPDAEARFDPASLDGVAATTDLDVPKSNWALSLDSPPFFGVPVRPGITFTYMGVAVDRQARVQRTEGRAFTNIFAAGELMSGNILSTGYLAGFGMTIGTVWGRIAGGEAAAHALR
jgi:tricarballylate dehydrogenase